MTFNTRESSRYTGRPVKLYLIRGADLSEDVPLGPFAYCDGETPVTRPVRNGNGDLEDVVFAPWPIKNSDPSHDGTLDKSDITVTLALGSEQLGYDTDSIWLAYPPSQVVNLTIFEWHIGDPVTEATAPALWVGRVASAAFRGNELELSCLPVSTKIKQPGLRRNYQIGCPHVLYGPQCRASKAAATVARAVVSVNRNNITLDSSLGANYQRYVGGLLEWANSDSGRKELRTISAVRADGLEITVRGLARGLAPSTALALSRGCDRQMTGCNQHNNIQNYGGQPWIPLENPLSQKNQFY